MSQKVAIVGFGYVGSCVGAVLSSKKYDVIAVESQKKIVESINVGDVLIHEPGLGDMIRSGVQSGHLRATDDPAVIAEADVVIITVGTPMNNSVPDTSQVEKAVASVAEHLVNGQLVILKSTVPPFTTERVVLPILESHGLKAGSDFYLAFCPERLAEGRALEELQRLPVVVGGVDDESTTKGVAFWEEALGLPTIRVSDAKTAELSKLADNWWIDLSIAMANELALLSDRLDVDVLEVISAANSLPKGTHHVNILLPSMGVGGSCLTKDPWFVHHLAEENGLELRLPATGRAINDRMPDHTFGLIEQGLASAGKNLGDATVAVLGLAFKNNTGDVRLTPTKRVVELLEASGCDLRVFDPLVDPQDHAGITSVSPSKDFEDALDGADAVAFLTGHDEFKRLEIEDLAGLVAPGCIVIDGRMYYTSTQIDQLRKAGLSYRGIGR